MKKEDGTHGALAGSKRVVTVAKQKKIQMFVCTQNLNELS